ncbi:MAG: ribosome assembly factor SBDS [Candidatus Aenigmarchaeota archaeon]|nr:ribosome assembly factor SBDS [Candidatus Aenigmarchaeota archaeon]
MVTVDKAIIARIEKGKKHFEILVDPELAYDMRSGKSVSLQKMLAVNEIFYDAKKGDRASPDEISKIFKTNDIVKIADEIVKEGDIQLTTEFRRRKADEKKHRIASIISEKAVDPRTKAPHPIERIISAIDQARVSIDPLVPAERQVEHVINGIKAILPISVEETELTISIDAKYSGQVYGILKGYGNFSDQWSGNTLVVKIKIPASLKEKIYSQLAKLTGGNVNIQEKH